MKSISRMVGLLLVLSGLSAAVYYFAFFDISVEVPKSVIFGTTIGGGRVANLSLMSERQNGMIFGFGVALVGGVFIYLGRVKNAAPASDERKCPFCAEFIKAEANICRYCKKDLPGARTTRIPTKVA